MCQTLTVSKLVIVAILLEGVISFPLTERPQSNYLDHFMWRLPMIKKGNVNLDKVGQTLFIVFEDHEYCVGVGEEGPDEVFADMELMDKGTEKIVTFEILDIDAFRPEELEQYDYKLSEEQKTVVKMAYLKTSSYV